MTILSETRRSDVEVVLFGTPRNGFQIYPADGGDNLDAPWRSWRNLERFYVGDGRQESAVFQAVKGQRRWEFYYIVYGLMTAVRGGRAGACFGLGIFSEFGFPKDIHAYRKVVCETAVERLTGQRRVVTRDDHGRLCFVVDTFETEASYLDTMLQWVGEHASDETGRRELPAPVARLDSIPSVGYGTPSDVVLEILSKLGGVQLSGDFEDVLDASRILAARATSSTVIPGEGENVRLATASQLSPSTEVLSIELALDRIEIAAKQGRAAQQKEEEAWEEVERLIRAIRRRLVGARQEPAGGDLHTGERSPRAGPGRIPPPPSGASRPDPPDPAAGGGRQAPQKVPSQVPWIIVALIMLFVLLVTAIYLIGDVWREAGGRSSAVPPATENLRFMPGSRFLKTGEFLRTMSHEGRAVRTRAEVLEDIVEYLWLNEGVALRFGSREDLAAYLTERNRYQFDRIEEHIRHNLVRHPRGVPYADNSWWRRAIDGGEDRAGFYIYE